MGIDLRKLESNDRNYSKLVADNHLVCKQIKFNVEYITIIEVEFDAALNWHYCRLCAMAL